MKAIEKPPAFVCLDCGEGILGPIARPFEAHNFKTCDICGLKKMTLAAEVFRDYALLFEWDTPVAC
jgi:hypothetical protein